jgi:hypothetical protein
MSHLVVNHLTQLSRQDAYERFALGVPRRVGPIRLKLVKSVNLFCGWIAASGESNASN